MVDFIEPSELGEFYRSIDVINSIIIPRIICMGCRSNVNGCFADTGVGGAFEVVTNGVDGLIAKPGDSNDLHLKIKWCIQNREKVERMAKGHEKQQLDLEEKSADILDKTYKEIIKS